MSKEMIVPYFIGQQEFKGFFAFPDHLAGHSKFPCVLVVHAWMGQDEFAREKARELAQLGLIGFAVDLYGNGQVATGPEEAKQLMNPLFFDRAELQKRINGAVDFVATHPSVDAQKIGAIGFCFGGLTVIELLRSGAAIRGAVSFHAGFSSFKEGQKAKTVPLASNIKGSLLILHGYEDPSVSLQDILNLQKDLTEGRVDWQMNTYSRTAHSFTDPKANHPEAGMVYNPLTTQRAWEAMRYFFSEIFKQHLP